jgi:CheY-like chemotaxis protein
MLARKDKIMVPEWVLVVEDEYLVALDIEMELTGAGVETVMIVTTLQQAAAALEENTPDCVLLDVSLSDGSSYDLARRLKASGIPFGFVSGYSDSSAFPADLVESPLLGKPFDQQALQDFVFGLVSAPDVAA